jgi:glucuronoarabinoxylan endo-1,4-beta-xylanase
VVPLYAISVQNEPDWHSWTWWEPNEMLKFVRENAQNINCRVIAPESFSYSRKMIDPLLNDSIANSNIDILGTHLYGTPKSNFYYPLAYQKGKEIWMTEHLFGSDKPADNTWELALVVADEINTCMDARMSAFVYWNIRRFYGLMMIRATLPTKVCNVAFFKICQARLISVEMPFNAGTNITATAYKNDSRWQLWLST